MLFVGRITRQKGIVHLARAIPEIDPDAQVVLCAGAPDTPEIAAEMEQAVAAARRTSAGRRLDSGDGAARGGRASCTRTPPSSAAPRCTSRLGSSTWRRWPATTPVVATPPGGIPEVVVDGETGLLVPLEQAGGTSFEPVDPARFSHDLAEAINRLLETTRSAPRMAEAGRRRVEEHFSWERNRPPDRRPVR